MKKLLIIAGILLTSFSLASQARSGGGGGGGPSGGSSSSHISSEGLKNTNGPNSADRDTGLDRAKDRMNKEGLNHEQATGNGNVGKKDKNKHKNKHRHRRQGMDNDKAK